MAWTNDDVARIEKAIAGGVRVVRWASGETTEYQSIPDMLTARDRMKADIAAAASTAAGMNPGGFRVSYRKGT